MRALATAAAAICLLAAAGAAAQQVVGVAKRVRGAAELIAAEGRDKLLAPGDRIRANDIVKTGVNGSALLQLADATVFTVGPNAEIKIDAFVYDPATGAGEASASIIEGAMRFISGRIAKTNPGALQIATPVGTIGVRGTIAVVEAADGAATVILLDPENAPAGGALVIQTSGGEVRLTDPGDGVVLRSGATAPRVRSWTEDEVNALLGRAGGGAWVKPQTRNAPAGGASSTAVAELTRDDCEALRRNRLDGAAYQPGVDSRGNAVAPADLGGGAAQPNFTIPLTLDVLEAAGIAPRFAGQEANATLGEIRIEDGQAYLGGALLDPQGTDGLRRLCDQRFGR